MASRAQDRYRSRSRSRDGYRHDRRERSVERERYRARDDDREEVKERGRDWRDDERRYHSRSRSPVRRSRSRSRSRSPHRRRRSRSYSRERDRDEKRRDRSKEKRRKGRSRSASSDASTESDDRRHKKKSHKRKRSRSKDRKERKKEKKDKKKKKSGAVSHQWGKYGIINETDLYNKEQEFRAWLVEERMINPETITKDQNKKEFARFVEDYNTATLPHEKFYNMTSYETRMAALRSGEFVPPQDDGYDPNADLRVLQSTHKRKARDADTFMSREQLMELRKVQAERVEAGKMKLLGMDIKQTMGVRMDGTVFDD